MQQIIQILGVEIIIPIVVLCQAERKCPMVSLIIELLPSCKQRDQGLPYLSMPIWKTPFWTKSVKTLLHVTLNSHKKIRCRTICTSGKILLIPSLLSKWWQTVCIINSTFLDRNLAARTIIFQINFWPTIITKSKIIQKMLQIEISIIS